MEMIKSNDYELKPQDNSQLSKAPKIFHETCEINFGNSIETVHNFIRGLNPFPTAWTSLDGLKLKIFKSKKVEENHHFKPGKIETDNKNYFRIATQDGFVEILELQMQGRKRMEIKAFLNGYQLERDYIG